jgi:hypothetical protein
MQVIATRAVAQGQTFNLEKGELEELVFSAEPTTPSLA